jgi:hypothetical protein
MKILSLKYLKFCQNFAKDVFPAEDKKRRGDVHESFCNYFAKTINLKKLIFLKYWIIGPDS